MRVEKWGRKIADDTECGWRNEEDKMRMENCGGKMRMTKCERKIADDKIRITPNADGKIRTTKCSWKIADDKTS